MVCLYLVAGGICDMIKGNVWNLILSYRLQEVKNYFVLHSF